MIKVVMIRDSVAAGDDVLAPHDASFEVRDDARLGEVFKRVGQLGYLPFVSGRGHSWHVFGTNCMLARFVANRRRPALSFRHFSPVSAFAVDGELRLHVRYCSARY